MDIQVFHWGTPEPGDYAKVLRREADGDCEVWYGCTPNGHIGDLSQHTVTEHEDGTITVDPSILVTGGANMDEELYHGHLVRGVWSP